MDGRAVDEYDGPAVSAAGALMEKCIDDYVGSVNRRLSPPSVLRHVYPLNASGTKVLTLGLDPLDFFAPCITLTHASGKGVRLSYIELERIMATMEWVTDTFDQPQLDHRPLYVSDAHRLVAKKLSGDRFAVGVEPLGKRRDQEDEVYMLRCTWDTLNNHGPLVAFLTYKLKAYSVEIAQFMDRKLLSLADHLAHLKSGEKARMHQDDGYLVDLIREEWQWSPVASLKDGLSVPEVTTLKYELLTYYKEFLCEQVRKRLSRD